MNEEQKNIETCLAEDILSEVANVPTDPQFRSLTDEALDPLKQQALQQAGYDGYIKVAGTHQPYTFTSQVKQMKSNLILLLRRLWRYPFGRGNTAASAAVSASSAGSSAGSASAPIRSLADMWQHYITRLKGNPEYGIPSRLSSLTDLPAAPALLADRKISGVPEAVDGISLVHLLNDTSAITELTDDNTYECTKDGLINSLKSIFPNITSLHIGCVSSSVKFSIGKLSIDTIIFDNLKTTSTVVFLLTGGEEKVNVSTLQFPEAESIDCIFAYNGNGWWLGEIPYLKNLHLPKLKEIPSIRYRPTSGASAAFIGARCTALETLEMPELEVINGNIYGGSCLPVLRELRMPKLKRWNAAFCHNGYAGTTPKLILLEVGHLETSANLSKWSPDSTILEDSSNLQQFLSNFKTYIAERLTDNGTGLTLTLSQEVRNAIHAAEDEYGIENIIITQKGWTISPAPN